MQFRRQDRTLTSTWTRQLRVGRLQLLLIPTICMRYATGRSSLRTRGSWSQTSLISSLPYTSRCSTHSSSPLATLAGHGRAAGSSSRRGASASGTTTAYYMSPASSSSAADLRVYCRYVLPHWGRAVRSNLPIRQIGQSVGSLPPSWSISAHWPIRQRIDQFSWLFFSDAQRTARHVLYHNNLLTKSLKILK